MLKRLAGIVFISVPMYAHAADMTVFGMELGQPLSVPECAGPPNRVGTRIYENMPKVRCFRRADNGEPESIEFPFDQIPTLMRTNSARIFVQDGNLVFFEFDTAGFRVQSDVLGVLTNKYGPPAKKELVATQAGNGGRFESVNAIWSAGDIRVFLYGIQDRLTNGHVVIATAAGMQAIAAKRATQAAQRPAL